MHRSKRTATVTSQDTVQLLSIGREDFFDIFMSGDGEDNMPEHIRFVRLCAFALKESVYCSTSTTKDANCIYTRIDPNVLSLLI